MASRQQSVATVAGQDPLSTRSGTAPPTDTDLTYDSPHHTIGYGATQAASGAALRALELRVKALEAATAKTSNDEGVDGWGSNG